MAFGAPEVIMFSAAALLLFGGNKIPELMKGLGKGIKDFKDAQEDEKPETVQEKPKPEV